MDKIKKNVILLLTLFALITIVSLVNIDRYNYKMIFSFTFFQNIILFWLLLNHFRRDNKIFSEGLIWFVFSAFLLSLFYYLNIGVETDVEGRVSIFGDNANAIGIKLTMASFFLINYCIDLKQKKMRTSVYLLMLIIIIPFIFSTASRVAFISLILGLIFYFILFPTKRKSIKALSFMLGFLVLFFVYNYAMQNDVLSIRLQRSVESGDLAGRDVIWSYYIPKIWENPIFGSGINSLDSSISYFSGRWSPHNVFIEVALYSGIVGLIIFLYFLYYSFRDGYLQYKKQNQMASLLMLITVLGLLFSGQVLGTKIAWVIFAFSTSYQIKKDSYDFKKNTISNT